jgi:hypothetical protein
MKTEFTIAANTLTRLNSNFGGEPVSDEDLQTTSEVLDGMISFMNLTGNPLVSGGLISNKMMIDNIIWARKYL